MILPNIKPINAKIIYDYFNDHVGTQEDGLDNHPLAMPIWIHRAVLNFGNTMKKLGETFDKITEIIKKEFNDNDL
ncbi:MAG: hypothetical protein FIA82_08260 [Melioribacter sp.]|nr:hypothetical protein [Melioribacter sp.]